MPDEYRAAQQKHAEKETFVREMSRMTGVPPGQIRQAIRRSEQAAVKASKKSEGTVPVSQNLDNKTPLSRDQLGFRVGGFGGNALAPIRGQDGKDGKDGVDGIDGVDGKNGADGMDGAPGLGTGTTVIQYLDWASAPQSITVVIP